MKSSVVSSTVSEPEENIISASYYSYDVLSKSSYLQQYPQTRPNASSIHDHRRGPAISLFVYCICYCVLDLYISHYTAHDAFLQWSTSTSMHLYISLAIGLVMFACICLLLLDTFHLTSYDSIARLVVSTVMICGGLFYFILSITHCVDQFGMHMLSHLTDAYPIFVYMPAALFVCCNALAIGVLFVLQPSTKRARFLISLYALSVGVTSLSMVLYWTLYFADRASNLPSMLLSIIMIGLFIIIVICLVIAIRGVQLSSRMSHICAALIVAGGTLILVASTAHGSKKIVQQYDTERAFEWMMTTTLFVACVALALAVRQAKQESMTQRQNQPKVEKIHMPSISPRHLQQEQQRRQQQRQQRLLWADV